MLTLDPQVESLLENGGYVRAHLVTMILNGVTLYYTENAFDLDYETNTFLANGLLIDMGEPVYTTDLRVNQTELVLSAAEQSSVAIFLNNPQFNSRIIVDRVYIDNDGLIIGDPIRLSNWRVIGFSVKDDHQGESVLVVKMGSEFADWQKPSGRRTTQASQQRFFSGDLGFEFTESVDEQIKWGSE